eukprot:TRINITY_DN11797_c0_g1_i1.p1 TRINITY_DN11797_c0_g1~~TRINITY_DN11797_c0_g1_i1.p1  ORF type:complete len:766 (-),score=175.62 TRINITY_DN11797_c0_g1_i1:31-2328(-)
MTRMLRKLLLVACILVYITPVFSTCNGTNDNELWIIGLFPHSGGWDVGPLVEPGAALAIQEINEDDSILPGNELCIAYYDTECNAAVGLRQVVESVNNEDLDVLGIIGAGCSIVSTPVSLLSQAFDLTMISWGSTSPALANDLYYNFYRLVNSDSRQGVAWSYVLEHYNWMKVATLNSQQELHSLLTEAFFEVAPDAGIEILESRSFAPHSPEEVFRTHLESIKKSKATIILLACYADDARTIFRIAKDVGLLEPGYQWLTTDSVLIENFWIDSELSDEENDELLENVVGLMGLNPHPPTGDNYEEFLDNFLEFSGFSKVDSYVPFPYEAAYLFAYVFDDIIEEGGDFSEYNSELLLDIRQKIKESSYPGLFGDIVFNEERERSSDYILQTIGFDGEKLDVSRVNPENFDVYLSEVNFIGSTREEPITDVPLDALPTDVYTKPQVLVISLSVFAGIGVLISLILLYGIYTFRNVPRIKSASPNFLYEVVIGAILAFCTVFIMVPNTTQISCIISLFLGHNAFGIAFTALFAKSWRLYAIFKRKKLDVKVITDLDLQIRFIVPTILVINVYLIIWVIADLPVLTTDTTIFPGEAINVVHMRCISENTFWKFLLFAVEGIWLLIGVFLSYKTRGYESKFNEASAIALSIYNILFFGIVILPVSQLLTLREDQEFLLQSAALILTSYGVLSSLFIPKFWALRNPEERIERKTTIKTSISSINDFRIDTIGTNLSIDADDLNGPMEQLRVILPKSIYNTLLNNLADLTE